MKIESKRVLGERLAASLIGITLVASLAVPAGRTDQNTTVALIEVPVRVFDGTRFVDDLKLGDFEIYEDGYPIPPESLFLVKGRSIARREGPETFQPNTSRTYYLMFQTVDWDPKLTDTVDHLFSSVLIAGDAMTLVTPTKPYALQKDALATKSSSQLSKAMQNILKKDILSGGGQYRDITRELVRLTRSIGNVGAVGAGASDEIEREIDSESTMGFGLEQQIDHYRNALMTMESLRLVDEKKLLAFANLLKTVPGRKTIFLFYAREYRPEINPKAIQALMSLYQDNPTILGNLMDLFLLYKHETTFNSELVKKAFADAGIVFHFIFMERKSQRVFGAFMREQSEDIFPGFRDIAAATGGITEISQNPGASFARASAASADYYLLCYIPPASGAGSGFRTIQVKVNKPGAAYTVVNRLGYFAR
ncbi:MAG: VWA domain-containing protein [Acidobacteria bacterium]|nr:VWA domain-containing protein [Acidobacteriota bacterium]